MNSGSQKTSVSVLTVCTGNICRSPMAEGVLRELFYEKGIMHIPVCSAGTSGWDNEPPTEPAVKACPEIGVDISDLRSRPVTLNQVQNAGYILAMEAFHKEILIRDYRADWEKTRLMGDFHPGKTGLEISDPYGGNLDEYRRILTEIRSCLRGFVRFIQDRTRRNPA